MKIPTDNINPAGIRTFDHRKLTELPEYEQASRAIDDLAEAITRTKADMAHDEWLGVLRDMAAALCFVDRCPKCLDSLSVPYIAVVEGDSMRGAYLCRRCKHNWTCSWATWAPLISFADSRPVREETNGDAA
jgi:hypothetical protein